MLAELLRQKVRLRMRRNQGCDSSFECFGFTGFSLIHSPELPEGLLNFGKLFLQICDAIINRHTAS